MGPVLAPPTPEASDERQSVRPAAAGPDLRTVAAAVGNRAFAQLAVQRLAYWAESDIKTRSGRRSGVSVHNEVLTAVGKHNKIFTEAPVPHADKDAEGQDGSRGYADLYKARTTVGIEFPQHHAPSRLPSNKGTKKDGEKFKHIEKSAPTVEDEDSMTPKVKRLAAAPVEIVIGDLKGGFDSVEAAEAPEQLGHYMGGFRDAGKELTSFGNKYPQLVDPDRTGSRVWVPKPRTFAKDELGVPDYYTPGRATRQRSVRLVLVRASGSVDKEWSGRRRIFGKLYVVEDPGGREGVLAYVWGPDQEIPLDDLPQHIRELGPDIANRLRTPVMAAPIARKARRAVARKPPPPKQQQQVVDPFPYAKWKKDHDELSGKAATADNEPAWLDAEAAADIDEANETARKAGLRAPKVAQGKLAGGKMVKEIKLWTGKSGLVLGNFRRVFGTAFTSVANLYFKLRDRVRAMLTSASDKAKSFGGGFPGAALKAAYSVIKGAARHIVGQTVEHLKKSLAEGTQKKLKALIGSDRVEDVEAKLQEVDEIRKGLEEGFVGKLESIAEGVITKYQGIVREIERVKDIVGDALDIVNKVKWGARVIACLSPPGIGCLWILAQGALEAAAARVVDTCWFKRKITPLINDREFVKGLPGRIAEAIRARVVEFLPGPLKGMFAKLEVPRVQVGGDDIGCDADDDPDRDRLTAERNAMYDLIEAVGEERFEALIDAMWQAGARFDRRLTVTEIHHAKKVILDSGVTAEQLRNWTKWNAQFVDKSKFGPLRDFVNGVAKTDPKEVGTNVESEGGEGEGEGAGAAAAEAVLTNERMPAGAPAHYDFVDVSRFDRNLAKGAKATLDVTVKVRGQKVVLRGVPMVVDERVAMPDGGVRVVLVPTKDMVFDLGPQPPAGLDRKVPVKATSTRVWRTWSPAKQPAAKQSTAKAMGAAGLEPATPTL